MEIKKSNIRKSTNQESVWFYDLGWCLWLTLRWRFSCRKRGKWE